MAPTTCGRCSQSGAVAAFCEAGAASWTLTAPWMWASRSKRSRQNQYGPVQGWPPVFQATVLSPPVVQGRIVAPPQAPGTSPLTPHARDDQALRGVAWSKNQPPNRNMVV
mmetsp:Transcript_93135/g.299815  ORF Transcript_93135/g.299815 Transcript_93135/m.299815 type:complete len:110 (+) Transcript_93135:145-474(+)